MCVYIASVVRVVACGGQNAGGAREVEVAR
jgi:hypothetical protein